MFLTFKRKRIEEELMRLKSLGEAREMLMLVGTDYPEEQGHR